MGRKQRTKRKKRSVAGGPAKRRERAKSGFSDMLALPADKEMFEVQSVGTLRLDVVPYDVGKGNPNCDEGELYYERTFFVHRNIGVNDDWITCPKRTHNKPCPVCEYVAKLKDDPEANEEVIKAVRTSKRMLLNVRDMKKEPDNVKAWHVSHACSGKALDKALEASYEDHDDKIDNFCDPEDGYYVKCMAEKGWQGKGFEITRADFVSRKEDLDDDIMDQAVCLDDILVVKDYEEINKILYAGGDDEDEDDEPKAKKKRSKKKKKEEEPEEDEDEDEDEPEEDEDDEPKAKKKKKKEEPEEDEDDEGWEDEDNEDDDGWGEDDDDNDEEEEPEPKKKRKKKSRR